MRSLYELHDNFEKYSKVQTRLLIEGNVDNPEMSIFIPTYKRVETLEETIASCINQMGNHNYEIIIINNDSSNQDVFEIISEMKSDFIYYYVNDENIGLCGNWNRGVELARAKYVTMIHDDDILSPFFLDAVTFAIKQNEEPDIIGVGNIEFFDKNEIKFERFDKLHYKHVSKIAFFWGKNINIAGITTKKDTMMRIGGYSEEYYPNEDTNLIYQAILYGSVIKVEFPLAGYRKTQNLTLQPGVLKSIIIIMEKTRKCIAKKELFAKIWMHFFDREYLYMYIESANKCWNTDIDYREIFEEMNLDTNSISKMKLILMKIIYKVLVFRL